MCRWGRGGGGSKMRESIAEVLAKYQGARTQPLADHPVASLIRGELAESVRGVVADDSYKVKGSPGTTNWAETPWVAVFDRLITESAQHGFYVVYLFREDGASVYLSLNQGTTEVLEDIGRKAYLGVLESQAKTYRDLLPKEALKGLEIGRIELGGSGDLTRGYEAGNIVSIKYVREALPPTEKLATDLQRFLALYATVIESRDRLLEAEDATSTEAPPLGLESGKWRWHKRTERNQKLAKDAKRIHGTTCMVCSFSFEAAYGDLGTGYIEAHHLTPISSLQGRPTQLDPHTDFIVACSNCHRMLHRTNPPLTPAALKERLLP